MDAPPAHSVGKSLCRSETGSSNLQPRVLVLRPLDRALVGIRRHLLPFLFLLYLVAYLDRVNISFAAAGVSADLGLTTASYGVAAGIFFLGYVLFEIPSNLMLERVGARRWISRILLSWGWWLA